MNNEQIKMKARRVYEIGRIRSASQFILFVLPVIIISFVTCVSPFLPILMGSLLASVIFLMKWRGEEYGFAAGSGFKAGLIAFIIPLLLHLFDICCEGNLEVLFCVLSGALGGAILGIQVSKSTRPHKYRALLFAVGISGLTAALGCLSLGVGAVAGLFGALLITAVSFFALNFTFKKSH
ncbi:MAG: hypothetical protein ACK5WZ_03720 [Pseudobdellovibrionaceae bacterium]